MATVVLVIHLMIALVLIVLVLLQRSEGGALGIGGGGGGGGLMSGRGAANLLTRATAFLAAAFFVTSLTLAVLAKRDRAPSSILDKLPAKTGAEKTTDKPAVPAVPAKPAAPSVPSSN